MHDFAMKYFLTDGDIDMSDEELYGPDMKYLEDGDEAEGDAWEDESDPGEIESISLRDDEAPLVDQDASTSTSLTTQYRPDAQSLLCEIIS